MHNYVVKATSDSLSIENAAEKRCLVEKLLKIYLLDLTKKHFVDNLKTFN